MLSSVFETSLGLTCDLAYYLQLNLFDCFISDLLTDDRIIFNSEQKGGTSNNALVINQLSEKLIEQFEIRIKEKDDLITFLKKSVKNGKNSHFNAKHSFIG